MQKLILTAVAASVVGLTSCIPPEPVPPRNPYDSLYGRRPTQNPYDIAPPVNSTPTEIAPGIIQPSEPTRPSPGTYPIARATENPDQVVSPYEPYNRIDISGDANSPRFTSIHLGTTRQGSFERQDLPSALID